MKAKVILVLAISTLLISSCSANKKEPPIDDGYRTVSFDTKGGNNIESQRVLLGEKIDKPDDPIKEGYTFKVWLYDLEPWDFDVSTVQNDMTLEAAYDANDYQLTLAHYGDENHGTITGDGTYTYGESVILNAVADEGYQFVGWYKNEYKMLSDQATYVYTMGVEQTLFARWAPKLNNLSVISEDTNMGIATIINGSGYSNESITVKAEANDGYQFDGWYNGTLKVSVEALYTFTMPLNDYVIIAKYITNEVALQRELGVIPVVSNDHKTVTYGIYPQTVVSDDDLIARLNSLETAESNGWYKCDNHYYAKANAKYSKTLSDGTKTTIGEQYWFKCERVDWTVLNYENNSYKLLCNLLYPGKYSELDTIKENFYNSVFVYNNEFIPEVSGLGLLSKDDNLQIPKNDRICGVKDYINALFATSDLYYWTNKLVSTGKYVVVSCLNGEIQDAGHPDSFNRFFRFAFNLSIENNE